MRRDAALTWCLVALLALPACATRGNQVEELPAQQAASANASAGPSGADEFGCAMGGALAGATLGAGASYIAIYSLGGPGLVSMIGTPIVTVAAVTGAVVGLAKATSRH